jgi:hypothetical protein
MHNGKPTILANVEKTNNRGDDFKACNRKLAPTARNTNGKMARAEILVISVSKITNSSRSAKFTTTPAAMDKIRGF